ncbi:hypothetical protein T05_7102 [Trichinella murrelli]|uniref:PiggyBac transposable element-derived protein domain-containing protein n=1 Tax=Trichinella murrelli TaxID=144512 RepID=A0A0V0T0E3_9BILA|nr:hypothetical protein T05_7102 [Trichinella murrelli]
MSLSTRAVTAMVDVIQENSQTFRHTLYFDNFFTCYYLFVNDQKIHVVKWKDNAVVKIASDYMTHSPLCVRTCNIGMGGVDILDRLAITYCLTIKPKNVTVLSRKDDSSTWNFIAMLSSACYSQIEVHHERQKQDQRDDVKYAYEAHRTCKKCNVRLHAEWGKQ